MILSVALALGRFVSADSVVPGSASGAGGGAATLGIDTSAQLTPLTVDFHETGFVSTVNSENAFRTTKGFWFQLSDDDKQKARSPWGPANPQALNRYSYVLNNPLRYTDPSGHGSNCWGAVINGVLVAACIGGKVVNESSQPVEVTGNKLRSGCTGTVDACTEDVTVILRPGESSDTYGLVDTDFVRAVDPDHPIAGYGPEKTYKVPGGYNNVAVVRDDGSGGLLLIHTRHPWVPAGQWLDTNQTTKTAPINPYAPTCTHGHRC